MSETLTIPILYQGLQSLSDLMMRRMEYKKLILEMSQVHYDSFTNDIDTLTNIYVGKFRPIEINLDEDICEWVFNGMVKFKIKIK